MDPVPIVPRRWKPPPTAPGPWQFAALALMAVTLAAAPRAEAQWANEATIALWKRRLSDVSAIVVRHAVHTDRPATFKTTKPCVIRDTRMLAEDVLEGALRARLAAAVPVPLPDSTSPCRNPRCASDTTDASVVRLELGTPKEPLSVRLDFADLSVHWNDARSIACASIEGDADTLLAILRAACPSDTVLQALRPCARARAPEDSVPPESIYVETLPEAIDRVPPVYPEWARMRGVSGTVWIQALVGKDGRVQRTKVMVSIAGLDAAAVHAVESWRFRPATSGGSPIAVWVATPVKFTLH